jgi:hypothetical protein
MATPSFKFLKQNRTTAAAATVAGIAYFLYNVTRSDTSSQRQSGGEDSKDSTEPIKSTSASAGARADSNAQVVETAQENLAAAEESFEEEAPPEMAHLSDEQKDALRDQLGSVTTEIASQMMSIQQEMTNMKSQLYQDSGLDGIKAQLEALKNGNMEGLSDLVGPQATANANSIIKAQEHAQQSAEIEQEQEQEEEEDDGVLREDSLVEARWQGGKEYFPARIHIVNGDGTFNLHYADGGRERNVKLAFMRKRVAGSAASAGDPAAEGANAEASDLAVGENTKGRLDKSKVPGMKPDGSFDPGEFDKFMREEYNKVGPKSLTILVGV